jgi:hypothetical protein
MPQRVASPLFTRVTIFYPMTSKGLADETGTKLCREVDIPTRIVVLQCRGIYEAGDRIPKGGETLQDKDTIDGAARAEAK